ncbi:hypothetical protein LOAG_08580 [Loa loa]|uniref:Uncharacterized protein n=1 Tax=Loa loa TaxID=7209 RepID=A0A1S0TTE4_LOALO|nr:hypothetical protein LOAG_08580 [Loa loa]EFO19915.1 hypothetical protein LOAG_08580 [Loa loa]
MKYRRIGRYASNSALPKNESYQKGQLQHKEWKGHFVPGNMKHIERLAPPQVSDCTDQYRNERLEGMPCQWRSVPRSYFELF